MANKPQNRSYLRPTADALANAYAKYQTEIKTPNFVKHFSQSLMGKQS
jgi:hypothetical protein